MIVKDSCDTGDYLVEESELGTQRPVSSRRREREIDKNKCVVMLQALMKLFDHPLINHSNVL